MAKIDKTPHEEAMLALRWIANTPAQAHEYRKYAQDTLQNINNTTKQDVLMVFFMEAMDWGSSGFLLDNVAKKNKAKEMYAELVSIYPELK